MMTTINARHRGLNRLKSTAILLICILLSCNHGCGLFRRPPPPLRIDGPALRQVPVNQYPQFSDDLHYHDLENSIHQSLLYLRKIPPDRVFRFHEDSFDTRHMIQSLVHFSDFIRTRPSLEDLQAFIASDFRVYKSIGNQETGEVLFTGYYEPMLTGSLEKSPDYPYPVFSLPQDLAFINLSLFDPRFEGEKKIIGRFTNNQNIVPYYQRGEITDAVLRGKSVPLAWVNDRIDLFFLEIQGSGKIQLENQQQPINIHYHTSNGHRYKSIGTLLIKEKKISREEMSMQKIREYLNEHPEDIDRILNYNPSFIFFKTEKNGPLGCLGVPVTPGRSLALQKRIFPSAALAFIESKKPRVDDNNRIFEWTDFKRFVLNQDTGGAIRGPGRADLFWGNGPYAEIAAGYMQHPGSLYFLILNPDRVIKQDDTAGSE